MMRKFYTIENFGHFDRNRYKKFFREPKIYQLSS